MGEMAILSIISMPIMKIKTSSPRKKGYFFRGQGMVEFALVIPVLLTLIFGIFEVGRAYWIYSAVTTSSREAARLGSSVGDNGSGIPNYLDCDAIRAAAKRLGQPGQVVDADITITYDDGPSGNNIGSCPVAANALQLGDRIVVTVIGHFDPIPAMPLISLPTFDITSVSRRTIIKALNLASTAFSGSTNTPGGPTNTPSGSTNTSTPDNSPTPSNTFVPSATFTISPTPSITFTPSLTTTPSLTPTASQTSTPSATSTPDCSVAGGVLVFNNDKLQWNLANNSNVDIQITSIFVDWVDSPSNQKVDRIKLDGNEIFHQHLETPPSNITSGWNSNASRRILSANSAEILEIDFGTTLVQSGISMTVGFDLGCSVMITMPTSTPTPGPTLTSTPGCSVAGGLLVFNNDKLQWNLANNSIVDIQIISIFVDWVDSPSNQKVDRIKLDGNEIFHQHLETPPSNITSGWNSNASRRILSANSAEILEIDFGTTLVQSGISMTVGFDLGCSVSISQ